MPDCEDCKGYPLIDKRINDIEDFKKGMERPGNGTIDRIWTAIENRASKGFLITMAAIIIAFVGTLFSLVFYSNQNILTQFGDIKKDIAVISKVVELKTGEKE